VTQERLTQERLTQERRWLKSQNYMGKVRLIASFVL
jgi:hypothetical protein